VGRTSDTALRHPGRWRGNIHLHRQKLRRARSNLIRCRFSCVSPVWEGAFPRSVVAQVRPAVRWCCDDRHSSETGRFDGKETVWHLTDGDDFRSGSNSEVWPPAPQVHSCQTRKWASDVVTSRRTHRRAVRRNNRSRRTSASCFSISSSGLLNAGALRTQGRPRPLLRRAGG
jgi:hypothetical protein